MQKKYFMGEGHAQKRGLVRGGRPSGAAETRRASERGKWGRDGRGNAGEMRGPDGGNFVHLPPLSI
jgi:hypothetical protein